MKIGFFTDAYLPEGFGVQTSIDSFRKNLEDLGNEVYVFAPFFKSYKDANPRVFRFPSLKVIEKPEMRLAYSFLPVKSLEKINKLKFDIIHAHTPFTLGFLGKRVARQQKIPLIYTHHTQYADYAKFYLKEKILLPYIARSLISRFSNKADFVISPSYKIKNFLRELNVKKPIFILPTGIDTGRFGASEKNRTAIRKKLDLSQNAKIVIFVGRMGEEKNIDFILEAFKEVLKRNSQAVLLMVGDGPHFENLRQNAKNLGIESSVVFTGSIDRKEVPRYYRAADVFVFASLTDTQGIVILEAMASGLPVVALKDDALKGILIPGKNGFFVNPKNRNSRIVFAKKILEIFENFPLSKKFEAFALKTASQFSEKKQAGKLLAIYRKLIRLNKKK